MQAEDNRRVQVKKLKIKVEWDWHNGREAVKVFVGHNLNMLWWTKTLSIRFTHPSNSKLKHGIVVSYFFLYPKSNEKKKRGKEPNLT